MESQRLPPAAGSETAGLSPLMWLAGALVVLAAMGLVYWLARRQGSESERLPIDVARVRLAYLICLVVYLLLAIYASLVPWEMRALDWPSAVEQFRAIRYLNLGVASRADWVANILLFIPLAYLATAVMTLGVRAWPLRAAGAAIVVGCCAVLCVAIEFTQLWFPKRTVSLNDIIAETIGAVIGAVLWLLMGVTMHGWLAAYFQPQRRRSQIDRLLEFYLAGLLIYSLLPLDLTIHPVELYHKLKAGKLVLIPFTDRPWTVWYAYTTITDILVFIPVGMYCATAFTPQQRPLRGLMESTLLGAGVGLAIELMQIFVYTHYTSVTTVILAAIGSCIGAIIMRRYRSTRPDDLQPWTDEWLRRVGTFCYALIGLYSLVLIGVFCSGGKWETDPVVLAERFGSFWSLPFARLYRGSEKNAIDDILRKLLFFMPLGALGAGVVMGWPSLRRSLWRSATVVLLYAAGVSFSIEMIQVFRPPVPKETSSPNRAAASIEEPASQQETKGPSHVADFGDVLVCTAGAAIGLALTLRTLKAGSSDRAAAGSQQEGAVPAAQRAAQFVNAEQ